ncbi:hypothetical protein [Bradyrhizobium sp. S3.2.12]|uniref:hypothetical protein n=1 Tax=Bradyrhizobium sp. S3.2.12 TaxID=3156387 RepID=UPI0033936BEB
MEDFDGLSDHFILRMYEFIRHEVHVDASAGTRLIGLATRQRADRLLKEIDSRGLFQKPIDWPDDPAMESDRCDAPAFGLLKTT